MQGNPNDHSQELVKFFNDLTGATDPHIKLQHAKAIEEMLLHRAPNLLPQYLDDVLHLASESAHEVKVWVVGFIDRLLANPKHIRANALDMFTKLGQILQYLLSMDRAQYLAKVIAIATAYCQKLQPFLITNGRSAEAPDWDKWDRLWTITSAQVRSKALKCLKRESGAAKVQCCIMLKDLILLYSPRPSETFHLERVSADNKMEFLPQCIAGLDGRVIQGNSILKLAQLQQISEQLAEALIETVKEESTNSSVGVQAIQGLHQVLQKRPGLWPYLIPRLAKVTDHIAGEGSEESDISDDEKEVPADVKQAITDILLDLLRAPAAKEYRPIILGALNKLGAYDSVYDHLRSDPSESEAFHGKRQRDSTSSGQPPAKASKIHAMATPGSSSDDQVFSSEIGSFNALELADMCIASLKVLDLTTPIQKRHKEVLQWVGAKCPTFKFDPSLLKAKAAPTTGLSLKKQLELQQENELPLPGSGAPKPTTQESLPPPVPPHMQKQPQRPLPPPTPPTFGSSTTPFAQLAPLPPMPPHLKAEPKVPVDLGPALRPPPVPPSLLNVLRTYQRKFGISKQAQRECHSALLSMVKRADLVHGSFGRMMKNATAVHTEGVERTRYGHAILARLLVQSKDERLAQRLLSMVAEEPAKHFDILLQWLYFEYQLNAPFSSAMPVASPIDSFIRGRAPVDAEEPEPEPKEVSLKSERTQDTERETTPEMKGQRRVKSEAPMDVDGDAGNVTPERRRIKSEPDANLTPERSMRESTPETGVVGEGTPEHAPLQRRPKSEPAGDETPEHAAQDATAGDTTPERGAREVTPEGAGPDTTPERGAADSTPERAASATTPDHAGASMDSGNEIRKPKSEIQDSDKVVPDTVVEEELESMVKPEEVEEEVREEKPKVAVKDPIGWLFRHASSRKDSLEEEEEEIKLNANAVDPDWRWQGEGDLEGQTTRYSLLLDRLLTELHGKLGQPMSTGGHTVLTEIYLQVPHIPLSAFQRLHFDFCMAHDGTPEENRKRMVQGLQCLEAIISHRPAYCSNALSLMLYYSSSAAQTQIQITAVRLILKNLYDNPLLQPAILAFAKHSLQRMADLRPPVQDSEMDERKMKKMQVDAHRLASLCLGLCMKDCSLLKYIFQAFTRCHKLVAQQLLNIDSFSQLILRLAQKPEARDMLVQLTAQYPAGAEMVALKIIRMLMDEKSEALRPVQIQIVRMAKYIYKTRTNEQDVRFLIPILPNLNKEEMRGRVLDLVTQLPERLVEVAFARLLDGTRIIENHDQRTTAADLVVFLHEIPNPRVAAQAIQVAFARSSQYDLSTVAIILNTLINFDPLPMLLMRTLLQCMSQYPKLIDFVCTRYLNQLIQKNIWESDILWKGFRKCITDYQPKTFSAVLQLPQRHQLALFEGAEGEKLVQPFFEWVNAPNSPVNKNILPGQLLTFLHNTRTKQQERQQHQQQIQQMQWHHGR